jgi:hypothetical protein
MALWGVGLGLGLGAAYGTLVGMPFIPYGIFGPPLGAVCGSIAGLPLGLLEGVVLGSVTMLRHRRGVSGDSLWYRRAAELACVVTCVLALALFWGITFWRPGNDSFSIRVAFTRDLLEALIIVVGPSFLATGATWWTARRVAGQYMDEIGEPVNRSLTQASGENLVEKARRG